MFARSTIKTWILKIRRQKPPEITPPRRLLHKFQAARTGYGNFTVNYLRLNHIDANPKCVCGHEETHTHFIRRRRHANQMRRLQNSMTMNDFKKQPIEYNCLNKFNELARMTGYFDDLISNSSFARREASIK